MLLAFVSDPLRRSIRNAHAQSGKAGLQLTFRAVPPGHSLPFGLGQHVFGGHRQVIRDRPLTRAATAGNRPDELHTHGVDLEVTASTQPKRTPAAMTRSISARAIFGFVRATRCSAGTPARAKRSGSLTQLSGRKSRNATVTGTSPRASVSDTNVWQLAFLPKADAYCEATPTECSSSQAHPRAAALELAPAEHRRASGLIEPSASKADLPLAFTGCVLAFLRNHVRDDAMWGSK